jgi:hypothetical protein
MTLNNLEKEREFIEDLNAKNDFMVKETTHLQQYLDEMKKTLSPMKEEIINLNGIIPA